MILDSYKQTNLIGHNYIFEEMTYLFNENKLPNKILLSGPKGIGKSTVCYHFLNYIFSKNEDYNYNLSDKKIDKNNISFKLILNHTHPNFYLIDLIDNSKNIEISQIRKMIEYHIKKQNQPQKENINNESNNDEKQKWSKDPATDAQRKYIKNLGGDENAPKTKGEASEMITKLKEEN